jgi:hypothetical protein
MTLAVTDRLAKLQKAAASSPGLLPTPRVQHGGGMAAADPNYAERGFRPNLNEVTVHLLPTPQEFDSHFDSLNISDEATERQLHRTDGIRRNTTGSLTKDLLLLKTPTAQLAANGGSQHPDKRRQGGHGPTLADQVEHQLLPTPAARDWKSGQSNIMDRNARPLNEVVEMLLPTPVAADGGLNRGSSAGYGLRNVSREISRGESTNSPSDAGSESSGGQLQLPLSPDEPASD